MLKKRILFTTLILLLIFAMLFSGCNQKKTGTATENTSATVSNDFNDTYIAPNVNYNGKEFNIMRWNWDEDWVLSVSEESSSIESQTYYHLTSVERELGVSFNIAVEQRGEYGYHDKFIAKVEALSGNDEIDLICQYSLSASIGAQHGVYRNLLDLPYLNWDGYYWSDSLYDYNAVNGKMYYCTGDLTGSSIKNMFAMVFNYDLINEYRMENPYALVDDGKWTIEKLKTLSKELYIDDNENAASDIGDTFGLVVGDYRAIDAFQAGANLVSIVKNSDGKLKINEQMNGSYGISVIEKLEGMLHNNTGAYCNNKTDKPDYSDAFIRGNAAFTVTLCSAIISSVSGSDINYGILPIPKYDEDQKDYHTCLNMTYNMYSVPIVARDPEMSGAVLESLAHSGNRNLIPVIYKALQYRYSNRPEDVRMLEILRSGIIYDPGRTFDQMGIYSFVRSTVRDNVPPISSWQSRSSMYYENIDAVNKIFE